MIPVSDVKLSKQVLIKARDELIRELVRCGSAGGTGRASSYAPQLVSIVTALEMLDKLFPEEPVTDPALMTDAQLRAANARAAKTAKVEA